MTTGVDHFIGQDVVLDTAGAIFYLGRLASYDELGYWLEDADVRNSKEGHATREQYIAESRWNGVRPNRRRVFVLRQAVISISALSDIITD